MESLISKFYELPIDDPTTGTFDEYSPKMILVRSATMMILATMMLTINLRKEFSALRYISVIILGTILFTVFVKYFFLMLVGGCPSAAVLLLLQCDAVLRARYNAEEVHSGVDTWVGHYIHVLWMPPCVLLP